MSVTYFEHANLGDKVTQLWATKADGKIISCWKDGAYANWNAMTQGWIMTQPSFSAKMVTAHQLGENVSQVWAVDQAGAIHSCWKDGPIENWNDFTTGWIINQPTFAAEQVVVSELGEEVTQIWAIDSEGKIHSCWKDGPYKNWNDFTTGWIAHPQNFIAKTMSVVQLGNNVTQIFVVDTEGKIHSCWKDGPYENWNAFTTGWILTAPTFTVVDISSATLGDKVTQIWAVDTDGNIHSCWKDGPYENWNAFTTGWILTAPGFNATRVDAAYLGNDVSQVWALDTAGNVYSCWKDGPFKNWNDFTTGWIQTPIA